MDPYKVLGVNRGDDEETIKKAYRKLVKKYHPDRYVNTPMADMATEKLKEINEAYDMITNKKTDERGYSSGYGSYGSYGAGQYQSSYSPSFESVRMLIRLRRLSEAEAMLAGLPQNAQWHYLMGLVYINRGWYDKGKEFIEKAVAMSPDNLEYRRTLESFNAQNRDYRTYKAEYIDCCSAGNIWPCVCGGLLCPRMCYCCC